MKIDRKQVVIGVAALLVLAVMLLFPPWGRTDIEYKPMRSFVGYHPVWWWPSGGPDYDYQIDAQRLVLQGMVLLVVWVIVAVITWQLPVFSRKSQAR